MKQFLILLTVLFIMSWGNIAQAEFEKAVTLKGNVAIPDAYHKIVGVCVNVIDKQIRIEIAIYKDSATKGADEQNYIAGHSKMVTIYNDEGTGVMAYDDFFSTLNTKPLIPSIYKWLELNSDFYKTATVAP